MKKRKLIILLVFVLIVALGIVASILGWKAFCEEKLTTIELPSGDRIVIKYCRSSFLLAALAGTGGLKYDIYSDGSVSSGELTTDADYDHISQVKLTYVIQDERRVKIEDGRSLPRSWMFVGDTSGKYEIIDYHRLRLDATRRAAPIVHAIHRHKQETGAYPERLEQIEEQLTEEVFVDPQNGGPFVYKREGEGFIFYSKGPNGVDEHGAYSKPADDWPIWPEKTQW